MTNTNNTEKRVTKAMKFADVKSLLVGEPTKNGLTVETALEFIDNELALLAKKNSADRGPTERQKENEAFKPMVLEFLASQLEPVTCVDILKNIPALETTQRITPILKSLMDEGKVVKSNERGRSKFTLA